MIKKTFVLVLILAVIFGLYFFVKNNKEAKYLSEEEVISLEEMLIPAGGSYVVDTEGSDLSWRGSFLNGSASHNGTISFNESSFIIEGGLIVEGGISVEMDSIIEEGNDSGVVTHLKSDDFFNVEEYPEASFLVTGSTHDENGFILNGEMSIKNVVKNVSIPVTLLPGENNSVFVVGELIIDRSEFDVRFGSSSFFDDLGDRVIDDMIYITFSVLGVKE